ncbi:AbiV family abortive infection protein [uncultured Pedobacter sp.]|uniref:AbiV family abortive infection protein n=1 Tax=uncultured Pedobacter sp. TaxID=246139 RepID=UPI0026043439|nr:AbiV family abortive infection protein [uncultured Pedobacter sp.]
MKDEAYQKLTRTETYEGLMNCWRSAKEHRECARLMAERGSYGIANSHLILGVEEAVKAMIFLRKVFGVPLEFDSIEPFFKWHLHKHAKGHELTVELIGGRNILDFFNMGISFLAVIEKKIPAKYFTTIMFATLNVPEREEIDKWWAIANERKNNGFYVGHKNGQWLAPSAITKEDYEQSERHVARLYVFLLACDFIDDDVVGILPHPQG